MKPLTERTCNREANAWGQDATVCRQRFEVESSDVGYLRSHFRGYHHKNHIFAQSDVGKMIEVLTDGSSWTCWVFIA